MSEIHPDRRPGRLDRRVSKTQRALKSALTELVLEKGYGAVTVQDIIDRADVGRSTFYAHYIDKDELLLAAFADLEEPAPDPTTWKPDDPPFAWTLGLFRHLAAGKQIFGAVAMSRSGAMARRETETWLDGLARAELARLGAPKRNDPARLDTVTRFVVDAFIGFMHWWLEDANTDLAPEFIDETFRALVLPGVMAFLGLDGSAPSGAPGVSSIRTRR